MKNLIGTFQLLLVCALLLAFNACRPDEAKSPPTSEGNSTLNIAQKQNPDETEPKLMTKFEAFIADVLGENKAELSFHPGKDSLSNRLGFEGATTIKAYFHQSREKYIRGIAAEKLNHENFILFVWIYPNENKAKTALEAFRTKNKQSDIQIAKAGGLISQASGYIFFLVETCRNTPVGGTWEAYEDLFLRSIYLEGTEVAVFDADCGDEGFRQEVRMVISH
ncbi:MAG: hypothetical protein MRZ79_22675 [Bacteroidia bacterium]|nr:hypothetical protein [Bacteroidia bacterium]